MDVYESVFSMLYIAKLKEVIELIDALKMSLEDLPDKEKKKEYFKGYHDAILALMEHYNATLSDLEIESRLHNNH